MDNNFVILIGSHNNAQWVESNLNSVLVQNYPNYKVVYFDDASTDGTKDAVARKIEGDSRFTIANVEERKYKTWFFSNIEHFKEINDNDILVFLDGDDMLYCENVLSYLNELYNQTNCWMTYGGMVVWKGGEDLIEPFPQNSEIPPQVSKQKLFRKDTWRTSHLKTMRAFVWKRIDKNDLMPNGIPLVGPDDLAIMFAALELTPADKIQRVTESIYLYNHTQANQKSRAFTDNQAVGIDYESPIRARNPYDTIQIISPTLAGGLGNQMFEVAAAASLAKDNNALLVINPNEHILPNQGRNINIYLSNIFRKVATDSNPPCKQEYKWDQMSYAPIPFQPDTKLKSHFQSFKYFDHNRDYIRDLFAPSKDILDKIIDTYPDTSNITAIQVRRGDYIKFPNHHPLLSSEYYAKAVNSLASEKVWVFSDDIQWCKENLHFYCPVEYIKDEDYIELYLMSLCKNIVISNSSFGWWSSYLSNDSNVYVPPIWFGNALINNGFKYEDLILPEWHIVK